MAYSDRGRGSRGAALAMAAEARRLVAWHQQIGEDYANAIQGRLTDAPGQRPPAIRAEIAELQSLRAAALITADHFRRQAERYERLAGVHLNGVQVVGAPA